VIYTVRLRGIIVGRAELGAQDPATGERSGVFRPGPGYELVQPLFDLHGDAYSRAMRALALELVDATNAVVPTESIAIRDGRLVVMLRGGAV
jgi:hypothetical protein